MGSSSSSSNCAFKDESYRILQKYGEMEYDVDIYKRSVQGVGGNILGWEHRSIVIDHLKDGSYIVIEWVKPGL